MNEENEKDSSVSLIVTINADRELFVRRTCPKCGLDFKISDSENNISWLLNQETKRQGNELGISPEESSETEEKKEFCCPYCEEYL